MSRSGSSGKASFVDESLFGKTSPSASKKLQIETIEKPGSLRAVTKRSGLPADVVTMKKADLARMLQPPLVMTADDVATAKKDAQAKREQAQAVSKARKERMMRLEEEAKKSAPATESVLIKAQTEGAMLSRAEHLLTEQKDEVKRMNQMMLYSKCVTIRDSQIEEKRQMMQENEEENRKLDLMMEMERIKALEQYEAREKQRHQERARGAKVLQEQIDQRERERLRMEELRDQERILMLKEIERLKEIELQAQVEKKLQAKEVLEQVAAANSEQLTRKELMKIREKEEDQKIAAYIRAKDLREQEHAAEKDRVAREKEAETARLRGMQERAADKQSELDELRARRYQESKDREWRNKERAQAERQAAMQRELTEARAAQKNATIRQQADMARVEHEDFMRVLAVNRAKEHSDMTLAATQLSMNEKYKEELLAQIQANEEARKKKRQDHLEEGARLRTAQALELERLAVIKERKIQELSQSGVPSKYLTELAGLKIRA